MGTKQRYEEAELVTALRSKDDAAFGYLYDHYSGALYSIVKQIVGDAEVSSDVLQETFVSIWRKMDLYDESKGRLFTWMLNIARNAAIDKTRSKGFQQSNRQQSLTDGDGAYAAVQPAGSDIGLRRVLQKLKEEQRQLIDLSYYQGFTHEQISKALDIPLGTVKTRIRTALTQLRTLLQ